MTWSATQPRLAVMAARAAGWTDGQRYMAMRYVGCRPTQSAAGAPSHPSVKSPGNTSRHFELYMSLAEAHARAIGVRIRPPRGADSWHAAASSGRSRVVRLVESIAGEAERRVPAQFAPGFLQGFIKRMTNADPDMFAGCGAGGRPRFLHECDDAQLYRVTEGLKAWVAREFLRRDLMPDSFQISAAARTRFFDRTKSRTNSKGRSA